MGKRAVTWFAAVVLVRAIAGCSDGAGGDPSPGASPDGAGATDDGPNGPNGPSGPNGSSPGTPSSQMPGPQQAEGGTVNVASIDVKSEGAVGNGVADDSTAIEAALNKGAKFGLSVTFPAGTYRLAKIVRVTVGAGAALDIVGSAAAKLVSSATEPTDETGLLDITGAGQTASSEVHIAGLNVSVGAAQRGNLDGIRLHGGMSKVTLENVAVDGASRWGIAIVQARGGTVTTSRAENNRYGGLGLEASKNMVVEGGVYSTNGTVAPVDGYGISAMSSAIGPCVAVQIHGVTANANKRKGIDVHSGHSIIIDANSVTGFHSSGIYAVNEDSGKDVRDITITNNVIDGTGAAFYVYGIEVGAFSGLATPSGTFVIRGNTIRHTKFTTSSAIMIRNPTAPGIGPASVVIEQNVVTDGAAPDAFIVRGDNFDVPVGNIIVRNNSFGAVSASVGIGLLRLSSATVTNNTVAITSGSVAYGILVSAPATKTISGNSVGGGATYQVTVAN